MPRLIMIFPLFFAAIFLVHNHAALTYTPYTDDPSIDDIVEGTFKRKEQILQEGIDRSRDLMNKLVDNIRHLVNTELGRTNDGILNNRINEFARDYVNDVWIVVDETCKALDSKINDTERRIEKKLGNANSLDYVEQTLKEMHAINWRWQDKTSRLLEQQNARGQKLIDDMIQNVSRNYRDGRFDEINHTLNSGIGATEELSDKTINIILSNAEPDNVRLRELSQVLLAAGREVESGL